MTFSNSLILLNKVNKKNAWISFSVFDKDSPRHLFIIDWFLSHFGPIFVPASSGRPGSLRPRTDLSPPDLLGQLPRGDEQQRVPGGPELRRRGLPRQHPEDREEEPDDGPEERRQNLLQSARCHRCCRRDGPSPAGASLNYLLRTRPLKGQNRRARARPVGAGQNRKLTVSFKRKAFKETLKTRLF